MIREDFDPVAIASAYAAAGADALSVLTDEKYFQGRLEHIHAVRDVVKLPVLRKDFIVDPYQVYESRAAGADAILLIAECLETSELIDLQILATEMSLTCLIEVHDIDNLMRVARSRDRLSASKLQLAGYQQPRFADDENRFTQHAAHERTGGRSLRAGERKRHSDG